MMVHEGVKLQLCGQVAQNQGVRKEDLVEGAEIVAAGRFVAEITSATNSLVY